MTDQDTALKVVISLLATRAGAKQALTIEEFCSATGLKRRAMEILLELRIQDMPFLVVSTSAGYFRPASADEINHCINSLRSRAMCIFLRQRKIIRAARIAGYPRQGRTFLDPPPPQEPATDLFDYANRRNA